MKKLEIESEIGGKIFRLEKAVGSKVSKEDPILIIESMKMEIEVFAPVDGIIQDILVSQDQMVEEGQKLVILEIEE